MNKKILEDFRDLKISKDQLRSLIEKTTEHLEIERKDLIFVLRQYIENRIDQARLLDWVNTIWFTDLFKYKDTDAECLSNIMHTLEELDERDNVLSKKETLQFINALERNKIILFYPNIKY